jgi:hypothetical protein
LKALVNPDRAGYYSEELTTRMVFAAAFHEDL